MPVVLAEYRRFTSIEAFDTSLRVWEILLRAQLSVLPFIHGIGGVSVIGPYGWGIGYEL